MNVLLGAVFEKMREKYFQNFEFPAIFFEILYQADDTDVMSVDVGCSFWALQQEHNTLVISRK